MCTMTSVWSAGSTFQPPAQSHNAEIFVIQSDTICFQQILWGHDDRLTVESSCADQIISICLSVSQNVNTYEGEAVSRRSGDSEISYANVFVPLEISVFFPKML